MHDQRYRSGKLSCIIYRTLYMGFGTREEEKKKRRKNFTEKRIRRSISRSSISKLGCFCLLKNQDSASGEKYVQTNKIWMRELFWIKISRSLKGKDSFLYFFYSPASICGKICAAAVLQNCFQTKMSLEGVFELASLVIFCFYAELIFAYRF